MTRGAMSLYVHDFSCGAALLIRRKAPEGGFAPARLRKVSNLW